ncbi:hypothetical protein D3C84_770560 [compost metagenome]
MPGIGSLQRGGDDFVIADPAGLVRQAPHADDFLDAKGEVQGRDLWQYRQALRSLRASPVTQLALIEPHAGMISLQLAAQGAQQRTFARTVRPQHAEDLSRFEFKRNIHQDNLAASADVQILRSQHQARPRSNR